MQVKPKTYSVVKNLYFSKPEFEFCKEITWAYRYKSVSEYLRTLIHEDMEKHPEIMNRIKE